MKDPASGKRLVWVHALDARNALTSLLLPFRMAAKANNLALWMYAPDDQLFEWMSGSPPSVELYPQATAAMSEVMSRVHPEDREAMQQSLGLTTSLQHGDLVGQGVVSGLLRPSGLLAGQPRVEGGPGRLQQPAQQSNMVGGLLRLDERVHLVHRSLSFAKSGGPGDFTPGLPQIRT
ncbi:hypothetical protein ACIBJF_44215 [Streptomyces sp. NPDC050743]|uniref:hypothetical protein n=1 Tax=Streptomyces sp. NPDC050743 TaxID=3365634 RepID=UPI00378D4902